MKVLISTAIALCSLCALADASLRYTGNSMQRFAVSSAGVRIDQGDTSMLYLRQRDQIILLNHRERSAMDLAKTAGGAMQKMQQALENVPPAQRKMVEDMMKKQMGAMAPTIEMRATGSATRAGYACNQFETRVSGKLTQRTCAAEPGALGLTASDGAVVQAFQTRMKGIAEQASQVLGSALLQMPDFGGLPVEVQDLQANTTSTLSDVQLSADSASFAVPADYKLVDPLAAR